MSTNIYQSTNSDDFSRQSLAYPYFYGWEDLYTQYASMMSMNLMAQNLWAWNNQTNIGDYWFCDVQPCLAPYNHIEQTSYWYEIPSLKNDNTCCSSFKKFNVVKRTRKNPLPHIEQNLRKLLMFANEGKELNFEHSEKSARGLYHGLSSRRSKFIGVLKNREQWQVLLNEGKVKKYIGTYATEIEAAIVNDFYSIGINGLTAKTNFSYTHNQVLEMICHFFENNNQFDPSTFASQMH